MNTLFFIQNKTLILTTLKWANHKNYYCSCQMAFLLWRFSIVRELGPWMGYERMKYTFNPRDALICRRSCDMACIVHDSNTVVCVYIYIYILFFFLSLCIYIILLLIPMWLLTQVIFYQLCTFLISSTCPRRLDNEDVI